VGGDASRHLTFETCLSSFKRDLYTCCITTQMRSISSVKRDVYPKTKQTYTHTETPHLRNVLPCSFDSLVSLADMEERNACAAAAMNTYQVCVCMCAGLFCVCIGLFRVCVGLFCAYVGLFFVFGPGRMQYMVLWNAYCGERMSGACVSEGLFFSIYVHGSCVCM